MSGFDWEEVLGADGGDLADAYDDAVAQAQLDDDEGTATSASAPGRRRP